jgi:ABC-type transport system involved in multi-copper enzyme maturation permease subunit
MIWLTWRQFRVQALVAGTALTLLAIYLVVLGNQIRHSYNTDILGCLSGSCDPAKQNFLKDYQVPVVLIGILLAGVPALIGVFWGAPLIARELEEGTHRLVWNQSVTRTRWLAIKLGFIAAVSVATTGLHSLLLTWSASRYDQVRGNRFTPLIFGSRNIVPLGYAVFAFVLGVVFGLVVRRTVMAMTLTLVIFAAVQVLVPNLVRSHLMSPVTQNVTFNAAALTGADGFQITPTFARISNYTPPGSWGLAGTSYILNADGARADGDSIVACIQRGDHGPNPDDACLKRLNMHFVTSVQPASRYWPFQWIELSAFLVLSVLLGGFGFWWIRNRPS